MSGRTWLVFARVVRSYENPAVWVPVMDDVDESSFMHAGTLRQVWSDERLVDSFLAALAPLLGTPGAHHD